MSKRTQSLPPLTGLRHVWREVRYHEASRQLLSVFLVVVAGVFGTPYKPLFFAGAVLILAGVAMRMWASGYIKKNKRLAISGPYSLVRHPLYTGNIILMSGFVLASATWWSALIVLFILLTFYPVTITYEDQQLRNKFPEEWDQWGLRVPALFPTLSSWKSYKPASWSFRISLRTNGELFIACLMFYLVYLLASRLSW